MIREKVYITGEIEPEMFSGFVETVDSIFPRPIDFIIQSPGGCASTMWSICKLIEVYPDARTVALGQAASAGAWILLAGDKRVAMPEAKILFHFGGAYAESEGQQRLQVSDTKRARQYIVDRTKGKTTARRVASWFNSEIELTTKEALKYGIIDEVLPWFDKP